MQLTKNKKGSFFYGLLTLSFIALNTFVCFIPILIFGLVKLIPHLKTRVFCTKWIDKAAKLWVANNDNYFKKTFPTSVTIHQEGTFSMDNWHLIITNHRSALDIFLLQGIFNKQIPPLKFLAKAQLRWVPLFGFAWWALGYPFMKRYSKSYIAKHPQKKGKDIEILNKALSVFKSYPSSIVSFVEGTRITPEKKQLQQSPFNYLLKPKAGGVYHLMRSLGSRVDSIIDVTICYPSEKTTLWNYFCRRIEAVSIHIQEIQVPTLFTSPVNKSEEAQIENAFRVWLNEQWALKDAIMTKLITA